MDKNSQEIIKQVTAAIDARFESYEAKMDARFEYHEAKQEQQFDKVNRRLDGMASDISDIKEDVSSLRKTENEDVAAVYKDVSSIKKRLNKAGI